MAQTMGCSKGTIMSRLFHARRNMQKILTEKLDYSPNPANKTSADESKKPMKAAEAVMP